MQEEAAEKMDEIMMPIDVSDELKKIGEPKASYNAFYRKVAVKKSLRCREALFYPYISGVIGCT